MGKQLIASLLKFMNELLHQPMRVLAVSIAILLSGVFLDGTVLRIWSLYREHDVLEEKIAAAKSRIKQTESRIRDAESNHFIERAARDQFDFVKEGDLVFVFSDDEVDSHENSTNGNE